MRIWRRKAQNQNAVATREQILLAVSQAFYEALQTQAVLTVAQQTVAERQTVANQINEFFKNKLKSELDLSFANVNLAQAKLLLLDAQNSAQFRARQPFDGDGLSQPAELPAG